ncbi:MAG: hypothetical protein ABL962_10640 [Fimbriimonadaceae bacterium]
MSSGSWKRQVMEAMPPPAWLALDAPHQDVVLSSRVRVMRNLQGFAFPHRLETGGLNEVSRLVLDSLKKSDLDVIRTLSPAERHYLVGCRLVSMEFPFDSPGRSLVLSKDRSAGIMINEEDHIRMQVLSAGWSVESALLYSESILAELARSLEFAWSPKFGFLAASPYNAGAGRRISGMFHLIGLAHLRRLPNVMKALAQRRIVTRGLFGESSRAIGAFVQVSSTEGKFADLSGACEYLMTEERAARREVGRDLLTERVETVVNYLIGSPLLTLADSLRSMGWLRWGAVSGVDGVHWTPRDVDGWLTHLEVQGDSEDQALCRHRAEFLREKVER